MAACNVSTNDECPGASELAQRLCWLILLLLLSVVGRATQFDPLPIERLSRQAELIVQGTIVSKTCQRDPEDRIYTRVELKVTDVWKGAVTSSPMIIVHSGGVLGEQRSTAAGQVNYDIGEEVVCFLVRNGRGEAVTLGLMQGKFHVWTDPATKTKWVASPFHGAPPGTSQPTRARVQSAAAGPGDPLSLADLKKTVAEVNR